MVVFEGAQGVLLDETHGFQPPHVTWTDCTFGNVYRILREANAEPCLTRIGCLRSYFTRHGAGPFPTENQEANKYVAENELHNGQDEWQGNFRVGEFDYGLAGKALQIVDGVDYLSLSHLDKMGEGPEDVASVLSIPIGIRAYGPSANDRSLHFELRERIEASLEDSLSAEQPTV